MALIMSNDPDDWDEATWTDRIEKAHAFAPEVDPMSIMQGVLDGHYSIDDNGLPILLSEKAQLVGDVLTGLEEL